MELLNSYNLKILEKDLDTFGHVNNATYLQLYEEARWDLTASNGHSIAQIKEEQKGPVILNIELSFKREILLRENIIIETYFGGMKNKLISTLYQKMINEKGDIASTVNIEMGIMDLEKRKLIEPHDTWWKAIGLNPKKYL